MKNTEERSPIEISEWYVTKCNGTYQDSLFKTYFQEREYIHVDGNILFLQETPYYHNQIKHFYNLNNDSNLETTHKIAYLLYKAFELKKNYIIEAVSCIHNNERVFVPFDDNFQNRIVNLLSDQNDRNLIFEMILKIQN